MLASGRPAALEQAPKNLKYSSLHVQATAAAWMARRDISSGRSG